MSKFRCAFSAPSGPISVARARGTRARGPCGQGAIRGRANLTQVDLRRLELARALACRPKLLIADEAMAGLAHSEVDEILALLFAANAEGVAVIMIEHIMRAVTAFAERLVVFVAGRKIADGPTSEVLAIERSRGRLSWRMTPLPSAASKPAMAQCARSTACRWTLARRNGRAARRQRQRQNDADAMPAGTGAALGGRDSRDDRGTTVDLAAVSNPRKSSRSALSSSPKGGGCSGISASRTISRSAPIGRLRRGATPKTSHAASRSFRALSERRKQRVGAMSGGEQQMVALGRALMAAPEILLVDEPSVGLAPILVRQTLTLSPT